MKSSNQPAHAHLLFEPLENRQLMSAGALDQTFGVHGVNSHQFTPGFTPTAMAIQKDGKIVVAGNSGDAGGKISYAVVRYNANGTLDQSFAKHGIAVTPFDIGDPAGNYVSGVAIQSDGKIVVAGALNTPEFYESGLVRYNKNGTLDSTFGTKGKSVVDVFLQSGSTNAVVIRKNGDIDIAGRIDTGEGMGIARIDTHGHLKTTYGSSGHVEIDLGGLQDQSGAYSMLQTSSGDEILGGFYRDTSTVQGTDYLAIVRVSATGVPDASFGSVLKPKLLQVDDTSVGFGLAMQKDGKFLMAGGSVVARFASDGTVDTNFGVNGAVHTAFSCMSVAAQPDGRILAMGNGQIERLMPDGSLDKSFGTAGKVQTHLALTEFALQSNQRIVGAGKSNTNSVAARYLTQTPDTAGNTLSKARNLGPINGNRTIFESLGAGDQIDYYKFTTTGQSSSNIQLTNLIADADLQLLSNHGVVIAGSSNPGTSNEFLAFPTHAGTYYLRVTGYHTATTAYTLTVQPTLA